MPDSFASAQSVRRFMKGLRNRIGSFTNEQLGMDQTIHRALPPFGLALAIVAKPAVIGFPMARFVLLGMIRKIFIKPGFCRTRGSFSRISTCYGTRVFRSAR